MGRRLVKIAVFLVALGLIFLLVGTARFYTYRFHGHFCLTEGEAVLDVDKSYQKLRTGLIRPNPEYRWGIQLEEVSLSNLKAGEFSEVAANLFFYDQVEDKGYQGVANLTYPLKMGGLQIRPVALGIAPAIIIRDKDGGLVWRGAPKLDLLNKLIDSMSVVDLDFTVAFHPVDRFVFSLVEEGSNQTVPVGGSPVPLGSYTLEVPVYRYWLEFELRSVAGKNLVYTGLAVLVSGLIVALVTARKRGVKGVIM